MSGEFHNAIEEVAFTEVEHHTKDSKEIETKSVS